MKKAIVGLLVILFVLSLSGCGFSDHASDAELQKKAAQLEQENKELKEQIAELQKGVNPVKDNTNTKEADVTDSFPKTVVLNKKFDVGNIMSITLTSSEWCDEIKPSDTSSAYSYYQDISGEKYFVVRGELKNFASEAMNITYAGEAEILINGKYKLSARMELEEADGSSFYGSAKSLQTLPLIIYSSVSDELYENCNTIKLTMNLLTDEEKLGYFYEDNYPHDSFEISFSK